MSGQNGSQKVLSPLAQKIEDTGAKQQINRLEGLLTESVNKS